MKSNIKRIISCILAAAMLAALVPAAFAYNTPFTASGKCWIDGGTITVNVNVSGNTDTVHVLGYVTPAGVVPTHKNAVAVGYASTKDSVQLNIQVPDSVPTGKYRVTVGVSGMAGASDAEIIDDVNYVGYEDRVRFTEAFLNAEEPSEVAKLLSDIPAFFDIYNSNSEYYKVLPSADKHAFVQYLLDRRDRCCDGEKIDFTEFGNLANEAFVVTYINASYTSSDSDTKRANLGLKNVLSDYSAIINNTVNAGLAKPVLVIESDSRYKAINIGRVFFGVLRSQCEAAAGQGLTDISDLTLDGLDTALTIQRINECGYLKIGEVVKQYNALIDVNEKQIAYVTKNSTIKDYFGKAMTDSTKSYTLPVYNLEDLRKAWSISYDVAKKNYEAYLASEDDDDSSGGGPSGGGPSGGKTPVVSKPVTIDTSIVRDDPLNKKKSITDYYNDMTGYEWAAGAVLALSEEGIVSGTGDMKFEPARTLKREEFMKLLVNTFKLADMKATCSFTDVADPNAWYYVYIASAQKAGITSGRGDGTFGVGEYVTREEMATLVYRAAVKAGAKLTVSTNRGNAIYTDVDSLSDYAREAVFTLTECGIMNGSDGKFSPKDGASRAQAALVINNIRSYLQ